MNVVLWVFAGGLAVVFLGSGLNKIIRSRDDLRTQVGAWVDEFPEGVLKLIGMLEVLGAIGLIVPAITGIAPVLVPLAALGLALVMVGAAVTHLRQGEIPMVVVNVVLLVLAGIVAWGRFGPYAF